LPVPIRTRAVAEAIPWSEDQPTADCEQDAEEVEAAGSKTMRRLCRTRKAMSRKE